jgi:hypothetical protein
MQGFSVKTATKRLRFVKTGILGPMTVGQHFKLLDPF